MTEPTLLYAGFDGLDMAYRVTLPQPLHDALKSARADAIEARRAVPLTYAGQTFLVNAHGGRGGYAFSVDTGVMGANWWFKEPGTADRWGARVSSRALPLATKGIEAVKADLDQFLRDLGMSFQEIDCRLSRIDYAIDFLIPEFEINPANFVTHSKRTKTIDGNYSADFRGDRINGIRIGKMPNAQMAIYDKRREVLDKKKHFWWDIWREKLNGAGVELSNKSPIWRFEFRAGKDAIEKVYQRKTWEAFAARPNIALEKIAADTRLAIPYPDTNRARWPASSVWNACQERLACISMSSVSRVDAEAIKRALFAEYLDTIGKQTVGLIVTQMAAYELRAHDLPAMMKQIQADVRAELGDKTENANQFLRDRAKTSASKYGR